MNSDSLDPMKSAKPFVNRFKETHGYNKWDCHSTLNGWYGMNYPRSLNKQWYKKGNDLNFQNQKPIKNNDSAFQSKVKMELPLLQGVANEVLRTQNRCEYASGQYHQQKKDSHFTLTTANLGYKKQLVTQNSIGYDNQINIYPISEKVTEQKVVDYENLFLDLIWRIDDVKKVEMVLDYKSDDIRHYAHVGDQTLTNQSVINMMSSNLLMVNFVNNTSISNNFLSKIGYHAPNLQGIELSGTLIDDDSLVELYDSLDHIITLKVSNCQSLTKKSIGKIINGKYKSLKHVNLAHMGRAATDESLEKLLKCDQQELDLSYCNQLSTEFMAKFATKSIASKIEVLRLDGVKNVWTSEDLYCLIERNQNSLKVISLVNFALVKWSPMCFKGISHCSELEQLYINSFEDLTDEAFIHFTSAYDNMQVLSMTMLCEISDFACIKLASKCPILKIVNLTGLNNLTEEKILALIKNVPNIKTIICNLCSSLNDKLFNEIVEDNPNISFIRNQKQLTSVSETGLRVWLPKKNAPRPGDKKKGKKKK